MPSEQQVEAAARAAFNASHQNDIWNWDDAHPEVKSRYRKEVRAALEAAELEAWQDVELAPRDGTPIIGAFWSIRWADSHRKGDIVRCWYQPEFEAFISSCREMTLADGYTFEDGATRQLHSPVVEPITHFTPLPAAPQPAKEG